MNQPYLPPGHTGPTFLVRYLKSYALQFHVRGFSVVAEREATWFPSKEEADETARQRGLRWGQYEVEARGQRSENRGQRSEVKGQL